MPGVDSAVPNHFEMLFRYMTDQTSDEVDCRKCFLNIFVIFMSVVMKSNHFAIIAVNSGCGDDRSSKITSDILDNRFWVTFVWLGVNIKAILMFGITVGFDFFERRTDFGLHFIKQGGAESIA